MEITFNYLGEELTYQCNDTKKTINDIFLNCGKDADLNSLIFLYSGKPIDGNLTIGKIISSSDIDRNKMNILVTKKNDESNPCWTL